MLEPRSGVFIDGRFRSAANGATFENINPATGRSLGSVAAGEQLDVDRAVASARAAFRRGSWSQQAPKARKRVLQKLADLMLANKDELALLETLDTGKPISDSLSVDIPSAANCIRWYAEAVDKIYDEVAPTGPRALATITREPMGVVGAIVPWNFPILLAVWKIGPALLTGNTLVLKPSPFTPLSTLRIAQLLQGVLPPGVLNVICGGDSVGPWMTEHPGINKISFTGSTATGRRVMQNASVNLKRLTLELGGNDAAIVLPDADVDAIAEPLFWAAFKNSGQVCVAAKRVYVHDSIYDRVASALAGVAAKVKLGNGADEGTQLGPVQNRPQFDRVKGLVDDSRAAGHRFIVGGEVPTNQGFFVPVTIVDNPPEDSRVVQEEAFGPVLPLLRYSDLDDAIARANACEYGLGGSVWSSDHAAAAKVAARLETGTVWINSAQGLTPFAAFAGHKQSGIGVENGQDGLLEFTVPQTIHLPREAA